MISKDISQSEDVSSMSLIHHNLEIIADEIKSDYRGADRTELLELVHSMEMQAVAGGETSGIKQGLASLLSRVADIDTITSAITQISSLLAGL